MPTDIEADTLRKKSQNHRKTSENEFLEGKLCCSLGFAQNQSSLSELYCPPQNGGALKKALCCLHFCSQMWALKGWCSFYIHIYIYIFFFFFKVSHIFGLFERFDHSFFISTSSL